MEIKRVKEESYESISRYLDILLTITNRLNDLCFVDYNGKRYMVSISEDLVAIVENDNGNLNPYYIKEEEQRTLFGTEKHLYEIVNQEDQKRVIRRSNINDDGERLSYLSRTEDYPRDIVEYVQFLDELTASLTINYDVTDRCGIERSLNYCDYHTPDTLTFEVLKSKLFFSYKKSYFYSLGLKDNFYYQPLINIGNRLLIGTKRIKYNNKLFMDEVAKKGFNKQIPRDLSSILTDTNSTYKSLKIVKGVYQNYIKEQ